jgi:hypothetical protein
MSYLRKQSTINSIRAEMEFPRNDYATVLLPYHSTRDLTHEKQSQGLQQSSNVASEILSLTS